MRSTLHYRHLHIVARTITSIPLLGASCSPLSLPSPSPTPVDCGQQSSFDRDGDGISDAIEKNNQENNYADLQTGRCDEDPTRATGSPSNGTLMGGLNLPDRGTGYRHYRGGDPVDRDDWGTLRMLSCLEASARSAESMNVQIGIGDISLRNGGPFPPHASHQNGLDTDLRYVRRDRQHAPLDLRFQSSEYDRDATQAVFEAFFRFCSISVIFVDIDRLGFTIPGREDRLVHAGGHSNHYHVRLEAP